MPLDDKILVILRLEIVQFIFEIQNNFDVKILKVLIAVYFKLIFRYLF